MSCAGNGYLSGNTLVAFPFEDGQFLAWESSDRAQGLQRALQRCFADAGVHLSVNSVSEGEWPSIGDFSVVGETLSFSVSACGESVRLSVSGSSGVKFPIVSGEAPWGHYVIVMSSEGISDLCGISPPARLLSRSSPAGEEGGYLRLCARCVTFKPASLESIKVFDGYHDFDEGPHFTITGDVVVKPGNNMSLGGGGEDGDEIELNAEPGAGLGQVECICEEVVSGNAKIAGPDGNVRIFNDTCYDLEPNTTTGQIRIHTKCTACCTCSMYESIVNEKLVGIANAIRGAKTNIDELLRKYESAVKKFNDRMKKPKLADISMTLSGMPVGYNLSPKMKKYDKDIQGKMSRCVFTATIQNSSYFDINIMVVRVTGTDTVVEASATWSDSSGNPMTRTGDSSSYIIGKTYTVGPGKSLVITFVSSKKKLVNEVTTRTGYTGKVSVNVSWSGGSLGSISKSVDA